MMNTTRIYILTFVLSVILISGLVMVSAAGFEVPLDQAVPTHIPECPGGFIDPLGNCICPPHGCDLCLDLGGPAYAHCEPQYIFTPAPTPVYPVPPPPPGGFGGFLQPITGNTFYTSLEYQITSRDGLDIRFNSNESFSIPHFVFSSAILPEASQGNLRIFYREEAKIAVYILTTGEFQINLGPDVNGDVRVIIFDGLDAEYVYGYTFNVYDILNP